MDCKDFEKKVSLYIDGYIDDIEKKEFELHIMECDKCKKSYKKTIEILKTLRQYPEEDLPKNFKESLHKKLAKESTKSNKKQRFGNWKIIASIAAIIIFVVSIPTLIQLNPKDIYDKSITEQSIEMNENSSIQEQGTKNAAFRADNVEGIKPSTKSGSTDKKVNRKIIQNGRIQINIDDYEEVVNGLKQYINENKGYIENLETMYHSYDRADKDNSLKYGNLIIRVPENTFDKIFSYLRNLGEVIDENISRNDITKEYYDTKSRIENLKIQEERLRDIMKSASKVEDILKIENELRRTREEIDINIGTVQNWDSLVNMSTITVEIREVKDLKKSITPIDNNIFKRSRDGFIETLNIVIGNLESGFIYIVSILPILVLILIGILIVLLIIKKYRKRRD